MRLGREQSTGFVEDTEAEPIASAELASDAPVLAQLTPNSPPRPAVIPG